MRHSVPSLKQGFHWAWIVRSDSEYAPHFTESSLLNMLDYAGSLSEWGEDKTQDWA